MSKRYRFYLLAGVAGLTLSLSLLPYPAQAATVAERVSGRIVLDVQNNGEAWYVNPPTLTRYYLGRAEDAYTIMRYLALGITNANLAKIPVAGNTTTSDLALRQRLSGRILLQVERNGEAWYVFPRNLQRYYMGRAADAFQLMTNLGLGITPTDLATIPIADNFSPLAGDTGSYQSFTLTIPRGSFALNVVTLSRSAFDMITDTGSLNECTDNCPAKSLGNYATENGATMGIHGTYFCPPDYAACAGKTYTYNPPVFNSAGDVMINDGKLPFHSGPIIAYGANRRFYYFHRTKDFGYSVAEFEQRNGTKLAAAIANYPSLLEGGRVVVEQEPLEAGQRTKAVRGGIGYDNGRVYLVIARSASVIDLAYIFEGLGADYAMNLDGGGSAALYYNTTYRFGPGRLLPNAILFKRR